MKERGTVMSKKSTNDALRNEWVTKIMEMLKAADEDAMLAKSNEIAIPCVDAEGEDSWISITIKVPTGSRADNEPYDGYALAQEYEMKQRDKAEAAKKAAEEKARKIARDEIMRAKKAEAAKARAAANN